MWKWITFQEEDLHTEFGNIEELRCFCYNRNVFIKAHNKAYDFKFLLETIGDNVFISRDKTKMLKSITAVDNILSEEYDNKNILYLNKRDKTLPVELWTEDRIRIG